MPAQRYGNSGVVKDRYGVLRKTNEKPLPANKLLTIVSYSQATGCAYVLNATIRASLVRNAAARTTIKPILICFAVITSGVDETNTKWLGTPHGREVPPTDLMGPHLTQFGWANRISTLGTDFSA